VSQWWLRLILLGIAVGVTAHLIRIRTLVPEKRDSLNHHARASTRIEENGERWSP